MSGVTLLRDPHRARILVSTEREWCARAFAWCGSLADCCVAGGLQWPAGRTRRCDGDSDISRRDGYGERCTCLAHAGNATCDADRYHARTCHDRAADDDSASARNGYPVADADQCTDQYAGADRYPDAGSPST